MFAFRSTRWRLALLYALVIFVGLALVLGSVQLIVEQALIQSTADRLEVEAGLIASQPGTAGVSTTTLTASDLAVVLGGQETAVVILDRSGATLAASANGAPPWVVDTRLDPAAYRDALARQAIVEQVVNAPSGDVGRALVVTAPIRFEASTATAPSTPPSATPTPAPAGGPPFTPPGRGRGLGRGLGNQPTAAPGTTPVPAVPNAFAQLAVSLAPIDATLASLRGTLLAVGLVGFAASLALAFLVTSLGLRPLDRVARAADRVAAGDFAARATLPSGDDEIGRLGRAFDRMVARLEHAFSAQRQFAADASHELRSPLTVLGGYVDVLAAGALDTPETAGRILRSMRREIDRLSRLAGDLLLLTQLEAGGGQLHPVPLDLAAELADLAEATRAMAPDRRLELDAVGPLPVVADRDRLTQALLNLVDNAVRHTPEGGLVRLGGRVVDGKVEIEVFNEGTPIRREDLVRLFDRFFRADRAREAGRHAGLGLPIVKGIVEASGGTVGAASDASGARFIVRLPLASAGDSQRPLSEASGRSKVGRLG
jgi:two-component system OmpR family sensor kinase